MGITGWGSVGCGRKDIRADRPSWLRLSKPVPADLGKDPPANITSEILDKLFGYALMQREVSNLVASLAVLGL